MSLKVDEILQALNSSGVRYLLIGGVNFLLRHVPETTFDVDIWIADSDENLARTSTALKAMDAQWGPTEATWKPVPMGGEWLRKQSIYCLTTPLGAVDIFREVKGLEGRFEECYLRGIHTQTPTGTAYVGLSDLDMLRCQEALPPQEQNERRIKRLREALKKSEP